MPLDLSLGVSTTKLAEELTQGGTLSLSAIVDTLTRLIDATYIGDINSLRVVALDPVADELLGLHRMHDPVGGDHIVIAWAEKSTLLEDLLELLHTPPLGGSRAVNGDVVNCPHCCRLDLVG